jgi:hypothetical protein
MPGIKACDALVEGRVDAEGNIIDGTEAELNEIVNTSVWPSFFETPIYGRFAETYAWDQIAQDRICELYGQRFPGYPFTCRNLEQIFEDLLLIGDPRLNSATVPDPVAPEPVQLRKAREQRQLRQEIESDLEVFSGVSTKAIERKKQTRPEYARMWNELRSPQFTADDLPELTDELKNFALAYNSSSAASLKMQGGVRRVGGVPFSPQRFEQLLTEASRLQLIRG